MNAPASTSLSVHPHSVICVTPESELLAELEVLLDDTAGDYPTPRISSRLVSVEGSFRGVLLHGTVEPNRAVALAVEALEDDPHNTIDLTDPDLVAVVSTPRWFLLRETATGDWHAKPALRGPSSPNAVLGTRVTFERAE